MSQVIRRTAVAGIAAAASVTLSLALPGAAAAETWCTISPSRAVVGPVHIERLKVSGTSCPRGARVSRAFHACRLRHGTDGRCTRRVFGYRCIIYPTFVPTPGYQAPAPEFRVRVPIYVECTRGRAWVTHSYTTDD